ncbi:MAG: hypothetical protein OEV92_10445 [Nitrospinota bacterium]|nr:hypothetical protein [Nitrospinota bacterium]
MDRRKLAMIAALASLRLFECSLAMANPDDGYFTMTKWEKSGAVTIRRDGQVQMAGVLEAVFDDSSVQQTDCCSAGAK